MLGRMVLMHRQAQARMLAVGIRHQKMVASHHDREPFRVICRTCCYKDCVDVLREGSLNV